MKSEGRASAPAPESARGAHSPVSRARRAAFATLLRVEEQDAWASEALDAELAKFTPADADDVEKLHADRRLAQEIVMGVLRWRAKLDAEIVRQAGRPMTVIHPAARVTLRMALYQITFLTRIPDSAAVNESVNLVKYHSEVPHTSGFVNGVLRETLRDAEVKRHAAEGILSAPAASGPKRLIIRRAPVVPSAPVKRARKTKATAPAPPVAPAAKPMIEDLEADVSHPGWMLKNWARQWGEDRALRIAFADNVPSPTYLRLNSLRGDIGEIRARLEAAGAAVRETFCAPETLEWVDGDVRLVRPFVERGEVYVQDAASQQVARWLGVAPDMRVLDFCAAPGGKTAHLAALMENRGAITALDVHPQRVHEIKENCDRMGASIVRAYLADGTSPTLISPVDHRRSRQKNLPFSLFPESFDAVLVDAPCSGTGTLRRHPEIKWRLEFRKLAEFAGLQSKLLYNAAKTVKPGGVLLYSICSLEEREGEEVVRIFLKRHREFEVEPPHAAAAFQTPEGFLRTWPDAGPDGFFAARLRRKSG
jgi:16S rRNA (cytosine967-C5)-methyltransferase